MKTHKPVRLTALLMAATVAIVTAQEPQGPVRVSSAVAQASRVTNVDPLYPQEAMRGRVQGTVRMDVVIDISGKVTQITVLTGPAMLREAATSAVSQWEYRPTLLNGEPVEFVTEVQVHFTLQ